MALTRQWKAGQAAPPQGFTVQSSGLICWHDSTVDKTVRIELRRQHGSYIVTLKRHGFETRRAVLSNEVAGRKVFETFVDDHNQVDR